MEPFSWAKFFSGFTTAVGWTKTAVMILKVSLILCVPASFLWTYHCGQKAGVIVGDKQGYTRAADWFAVHPTIVMGQGSTVNNNVEKKNNHFQLKVLPPMIGWCE